jgi:ABC-2 type transport system permease protein
MPQSYSQFRATWAISKAAIKSIFRSPQAVFFSLFFPIVLIVIFGALSGRGGISLDIAFDANSDTSNAIYEVINHQPVLNVVKADENELKDRLKKGRITALIEIRKSDPGPEKSQYDLHLKTTSASQKDLPVLRSILREVINEINNQANPVKADYASISTEEVPGREYKIIDFYLPGMLGFSLIGSAVFGVAFLFFSLRETLVIKRMFATPVKKGYIVLGECVGRVLFQLTTAVIIILFGKFFYHFTLSNGIVTFIELLVLSLIGLVVFMGFGFVISSVSKNQNVIPIYANLFMFPQYFLSGTFFPKGLLPSGTQSIINALPLTALNDAMRKVSFEGSHLWGVKNEIGILLIWSVVIYAIAIKVFKWE